MPRKLKPYRIGEITDPQTRVTTEILLDRNTDPKMFYGEVFGQRVQAPSEAEVRKAIIAHCRKVTQYDWKKIIVVSTPATETFHNRGVDLAFTVHEIARRPDGVEFYLWAERHVYRVPRNDGPGVAIGDYTGPTESSPKRGKYVLPWSEATEAGLRDIQDRLAILKRRIAKLLGSDDAVERLSTAANRMLLPAKDVDE